MHVRALPSGAHPVTPLCRAPSCLAHPTPCSLCRPGLCPVVRATAARRRQRATATDRGADSRRAQPGGQRGQHAGGLLRHGLATAGQPQPAGAAQDLPAVPAAAAGAAAAGAVRPPGRQRRQRRRQRHGQRQLQRRRVAAFCPQPWPQRIRRLPAELAAWVTPRLPGGRHSRRSGQRSGHGSAAAHAAGQQPPVAIAVLRSAAGRSGAGGGRRRRNSSRVARRPLCKQLWQPAAPGLAV